MKLTIQKSFEFVVDTSLERKRIEKAFKTDKDTRDHLILLMDLIEGGCWKEAKAELEGKWWDGYDKELECPRVEFIGMLRCTSEHVNTMASYVDLIYAMVDCPHIYKLIRKD